MAYLIVESGSNQAQQFEIHDEAVICRHSSCDIVLAAAGMFRRQCRLFPAAYDQFFRCFLARSHRSFGAEDSEALSLR